MKKYYWTGISREERTKKLHELTQIISRFGTVINFLDEVFVLMNIYFLPGTGNLEIENTQLAD
jgi:hypothetical protein